MNLIKKWMSFLLPPSQWGSAVLIVAGIFIGLLFYLVHISKVTSYFSDKPETCVNCHIMAPQFTTWSHSSHREITNCNSCHVPHNNIFNHYYFKAKDGMRHATIFTLRKEPQVIFIKEDGIGVVQNNCLRCHQDLVLENHNNLIDAQLNHARSERLCWECHRETPHGRVNSLSSVPYARVPLPESPVPTWLKKMMKKNAADQAEKNKNILKP